MLNKKGFDLWSGQYDQSVKTSDDNNEYPFAGYHRLMEAVYSTVMERAPAKVLDIGIGTGFLASKLAQAGNEIVGIDFSEQMLKQTAQKIPNARLYEFDFSNGLPPEILEEKFDFIISTYAMHHLTDDKKIVLFRELRKRLNPGGAIIIGDVSFMTEADMQKCEKASGDDWDCDEHYLVFEDFAAMLNYEFSITFHEFSNCSGILEIR